MSDQRADYFEYLENVVGIKSILQTPIQNPSLTPKSVELLFAVEDYLSYQADEQDLLRKMIAAVKISPERFAVCDLSETQNYQAKVVVVFQDESRPQLIPSRFLVQTFSPRVLLKKPDFKKQAWTELQKILPHLT